MSTNRNLWKILGVIALAGLTLLVGTIVIGWVFFSPNSDISIWQPRSSEPLRPGRPGTVPGQSFASNGEQIFMTGTSQTGPAITSQMGGMQGMMSGGLACANCHGTDGKGRTVRMMMSTFEAPDIRYSALTMQHEDHPPYTDATIKQAITQGIDPGGKPLEWQMPRWNMTDSQLNDLIAYLKTLK